MWPLRARPMKVSEWSLLSKSIAVRIVCKRALSLSLLLCCCCALIVGFLVLGFQLPQTLTMAAFHRLLAQVRLSCNAACNDRSGRLSTHMCHFTADTLVRSERGCLLQGLSSAESYPSSAGRQARQLLQYNNGYNNGYYGNRGYHWSGGRIAGVIVGCVCFGLAILFALLACTLRRRRMARVRGALMRSFLNVGNVCVCHAAILTPR